MPKHVDHQKRKIEIAQATWKVIVEEGLEKATVRKIAKVAGMSVGSLRHYFPTQSELLQFSMELVLRRIEQRLHQAHYKGSPLKILMDILHQLLPADKEKRVETEVWFVFLAKSLVDSHLKPLANQLYTDLQKWIEMIVNRLQEEGLLKKTIDPKAETDRLHVLIDGMAINHLLYPDMFTLEQMSQTLQYHLQSICQFDKSSEQQKE